MTTMKILYCCTKNQTKEYTIEQSHTHFDLVFTTLASNITHFKRYCVHKDNQTSWKALTLNGFEIGATKGTGVLKVLINGYNRLTKSGLLPNMLLVRASLSFQFLFS